MNETGRSSMVRERGYEVLFLLYGVVHLALRPTQQGLDELQRMIDADQARRAELRRLEKRGLVESGGERAGKVLRLTEVGRQVFAGGRDPEAAWNRAWDGQWRLLVFDLPRGASQARVRFWRWLRNNYFGRLQGSVWVSPDAVAGLAAAAAEAGLDSSMVVLFTGSLDGGKSPRDAADGAWDFAAIDRAWQSYLGFARRSLRQIHEKAPTTSRFREILRGERHHWREALRLDPLLPRELLPASYAGFDALAARKELHTALLATLEHTAGAK